MQSPFSEIYDLPFTKTPPLFVQLLTDKNLFPTKKKPPIPYYMKKPE